MKAIHSISALAVAATVLSSQVVSADPHEVSWSGSTGIWSEGSHWSGGVVPNNGFPSSEDTYDVVIDSIDFIDSVVTLDTDVALNKLTILDASIETFGAYSITATTIDIHCFIAGGDGVLTLQGTSHFGTPESGGVCIDIMGGATLVNAGTFNHGAGDDGEGDYYYGDVLILGDSENETKFVNSGTYNADISEVDVYVHGGDYDAPEMSLFVNSGLITKTGNAAFVVTDAASFVNSGTVAVNEGVFEFSYDADGTTGDFIVANGATLSLYDGSGVTLKTGASISGEGLLDITRNGIILEENSSVTIDAVTVNSGGYVVVNEGSTFEVAHLTIDGGSADFIGDVTVTDASLLGGALYGDGAFTTTGEVTIRHFTIGGTGIKTFSGTTTMTGGSEGGWTLLEIESNTEVVNSGAFIQDSSDDDGIHFSTDGGTGSSIFRNTGTFTSLVGESFVSSIFGEYGNLAQDRFINEGTFIKGGEGTLRVWATGEFRNDVLVEVREGIVLFEGGISGTGTVLVKGGDVNLGLTTSTNKIQLAGGRLLQSFDASSSIVLGAVKVESAFDNGVSTTAQIRAGLVGSEATTLTMAFVVDEAETLSVDEVRASDVFHFQTSEDILFTLELSLTDGDLKDAYLGWLNADNLWVNAVDNNQGNNATGEQLGYTGTFAEFQIQYDFDLTEYIGAWGGTADGVWAVINHDGSFAAIEAIPEPGTWALLAAGGVGFLAMRGRRFRL